jgi:hypothetical protein
MQDYTIIPAPATIRPLDGGFAWKSDLVDYARHPAYAGLIAKAGLGDKIGTLTAYAGRFALLLTKRVIRYEMIPYEFRKAKTWGERLGFVTLGMRNALGLGQKRVIAPAPTPVLDVLEAGGCAVVMMPEARMSELSALAKPCFDDLAARRGRKANRRAFDESRATADRRTTPELFTFIETLFAESGISDAASAYMGRKARLIDVNPQINDPSDSFWRDIFEDMGDGQSLPRTAYFHRDASGGDLKLIIYCSDVDAQTGPFSYAVGSNQMKISRIDDLLAEANDHNGLSGTDLPSRQKFAALPAKLRQKGTFGNDLSDDAPESAQIADAVWQIEAPRGSMVLFDTKGIHRGGMVDQGERRVITCVLG